jgi:hypothetical protein
MNPASLEAAAGVAIVEKSVSLTACVARRSGVEGYVEV